MKTPFTILVLLLSIGLFAQNPEKDSVDYYISMLNPNSAIIGTTYAPKITFDSTAQRLISLKSTGVARKLYAHLGEKDKTVAIHAILTRRFRLNSPISQNYKYKADTISAVDFTYNGLRWQYDLTSGQSDVSDSEIRYAQAYWRKKITQ